MLGRRHAAHEYNNESQAAERVFRFRTPLRGSLRPKGKRAYMTILARLFRPGCRPSRSCTFSLLHFDCNTGLDSLGHSHPSLFRKYECTLDSLSQHGGRVLSGRSRTK